MNYNEGHKAAQMMEIYGGGFMQALAKAYYKADSENAATLRDAFAHDFARYYKMYETHNKGQ